MPPCRPMREVVASLVLVAVVAAPNAGCGGGGDNGGGPITPPLTAAFTASPTAAAADRIKLVESSKAGSRITLNVAVFGPTTSDDIYGWAFDVVIGDPSVARFVPGSANAGNALSACPGQVVEALATQGTANDGSTRVVVGVSKLGGCTGNRVNDSQATVVSLTFDVLKTGNCSLSFSGNPSPLALDSKTVPESIPSIQFDTAAATLRGQ